MLKRGKYAAKHHLGGKLSTKTLRDEDGVGVHEMAKTFLHAIHKYGFHGLLSKVQFSFLFSQEEEPEWKNITNASESGDWVLL